MKCHYEILEVSHDAETDEIKSKYKRLALRWHPDKNLDNSEEAKEQFQLVQQAYEILSDPQERAWYDKHREQILYGANSEFTDDCLDVFQYFTSTCFKGYNDDEAGFYTVYRNVFDKLIEEDMQFMDDKCDLDEIPRFGDSKSLYEEVVASFYGYWSSYSTKKTYFWRDLYNITELSKKRHVKIVEKENKKVRSNAKKERNEEIRNLVEFVRKRDKRVQEHIKNQQSKIAENRRKTQEFSKLKRLERKQELENGVEAEWSKFDNVQAELEQIERHLAQEFGEHSEEDEEVNDLYCVACNKIFQSSKALENHELSKKHKWNTAILKENLSDNDFEEDIKEFCNEDEFSDLNNDIPQESKKHKKKNKKGKNLTNISNEEIDNTDIAIEINHSDEDFRFESNSKLKKKSKIKKINKKVVVVSEDNVETTAEVNQNSTKKSKKKLLQEKKNKTSDDVNQYCVTCKSLFPSKNKLFGHLKETGHGVYIPKNKSVK